MADRGARQELEESQAELKRVREALASSPTPGLEEKKVAAAEAVRQAREACAGAEAKRDDARGEVNRLDAEVSALSVQVAANHSRSVGLIAALLTPLLVGSQIYLLIALLTSPVDLPQWFWPAVGPLPTFLLGFVAQKRLKSKG